MAAVLAGYVFTLAPSVTFWDAGEFIAAAKILGIPHPPGTPLYVMLAHVWALVLPIGEYAWRTNLMSACFSAAGAAFWFLVAHEALAGAVRELAPVRARLVRLGGGAAAAIISAFSFTTWQNSNETEVYAVATFTIAAVAWLALRWRAARGTPRAGRHLLLAVYLGGLSIGNHLLALLVGPALIAFLVAELSTNPSGDPSARAREWGEAAVVAGVWALLIGVGLGNTTLVALGAVCWVVAALFAARAGAGQFAGVTLLLVLVGVSVYLFLFVRAGHNPIINEADPSTFSALLDVIRREQYGTRTPFDDPTVLHGPDNPGRSLAIIGLQLVNYVQYFDWQWARSLPDVPTRPLVTVAFLSLGLRGLWLHRRSDRPSWWLVLTLFLVTGLGLVVYMNFKPGYTIGYGRFPDPDDHEVRERDYFFIASFVTWAVWAGMGLVELARHAMERWRVRPVVAAGAFLVALVPVTLNFREASRRHTPGATLAGDFAYNLLNSVPAHGILFTYGDNDTFPLWWAQEVAGVRRDVTVVCLALADTRWYMRQLREMPIRPFEPERSPVPWRGQMAAPPPDWPVHTMSDDEIGAAVAQRLSRAVQLRVGLHEVTLPEGSVLYSRDFVSIRILQQNLGRRPIAWAISALGNLYELDDLVVQQGLAMRILDTLPDLSDPRYEITTSFRLPIDLPVTDTLLFETYRYAGLRETGVRGLDPTGRSMAATLAVPWTQMAFVAQQRGDLEAVRRYLGPASKLSANPALAEVLEELSGGPVSR